MNPIEERIEQEKKGCGKVLWGNYVCNNEFGNNLCSICQAKLETLQFSNDVFRKEQECFNKEYLRLKNELKGIYIAQQEAQEDLKKKISNKQLLDNLGVKWTYEEARQHGIEWEKKKSQEDLKKKVEDFLDCKAMNNFKELYPHSYRMVLFDFQDIFQSDTHDSEESRLLINRAKTPHTQTNQEICKCGHHTKDHSYIPYDQDNHLVCDICNCEDFVPREEE